MENSPIISAVKKAIPAVISIAATKTLIKKDKSDGSQFWGFLEDEKTPIDFSTTIKKENVKVSGGTGFIIDPEGLILTNRHVVSDPKADFFAILNDGRKFPVKILEQDLLNDIAFLKIDAKDLPTLELGESANLVLGQTAIAIGNALGQFQNTISVGVVSGLSRFITAASTISGENSTLRGLIQTDAAINPGNSGGPLIDIDGRAIGINAACIFGAENIGFAIPINNAKYDIEDIKKCGKICHPYLGLRYLLINKELQKKNSLPVDYGAMVISEDLPQDAAVIPGSPAAKAGIKEFDVILECQNEKISEGNSLGKILHQFKEGDEVELKILRHGKEMKTKARIEERK